MVGTAGSDETTFPVKMGPDLTHNGIPSFDAYVAKVNAAGTGLEFCGYIGGLLFDGASGVALDDAGNAYVTGRTVSDEKTFPVKVGPDPTYNGTGTWQDAFVAKVALTLLKASGSTGPGGKVDFDLLAGDSVGLPYQSGTSLGTGPIPIDTRKLNLSHDNLLLVTVNNYWPSVFSGYRGVIDSTGQAQAAIHIPNIPALIGIRIHTAFVTLNPQAPQGIKSISNTFSFSITK